MNWQNRKLEIGIGLLGLALFSFMYVSTHQEYKPAIGFFKKFETGFEMPRFRSVLRFFSLEGREVDRRESLENITTSFDSKPLHDRKLTRPTVAKIENRGKGQKIGNPKIGAAGRGRANAVQSTRRPLMQVRTQGSGDRYKSAFRSDSKEAETYSEEIYANNAATYTASPTQENTAVQKKEDKEVLGLEYWRNLLISQPTPSTAYKIVEALGRKKISEKDFFALVEMLLQSGTAGYQKLGLYMVYNQSSSSAFAVVAKNYDRLRSELAETANNYFLSFNDSSDKSKFGVLVWALASNQSKVQMRALTALLTGLENIRNGQPPTPVDVRSQRGGPVTTFDTKVYAQLLPQLQKLVLSTESQISQAAFQAISLLTSVAGP